MGPGSAAIGRLPDAALAAARGNRRKQRISYRGVEDNGMAPVRSRAGKKLASPAEAAVMGNKHAVAAAGGVRHAAQAEMGRIEGIDHEASDPRRNSGGGGWGQNLPTLATIGGAKDADT